jgi:hypothetical protein
MRTTKVARNPDPVVERDSAWARLTESGIRRHHNGLPPSHRTLYEISRGYDKIVRHAERMLVQEADSDDVLAALRVIRMLRDKLDNDERLLISQARHNKITWQQIADASEMSSRQSAERRHLQLNSAAAKPDGTKARTQSERVEFIREARSRRAEQEWTLQHGASIRKLAAALASLEDLEQRLNRSLESRIVDAVLDSQKLYFDENTPSAVRGAWPAALRSCLADHEDVRTKLAAGPAPDEHWKVQLQECQLLYRMFGLVAHAASPDKIDLSDQPELAAAVAELCLQQQDAMGRRRC